MIKKIPSLICFMAMLTLLSCNKKVQAAPDWEKKAVVVATYQLKLTSTEIVDSLKMPRSVRTDYGSELYTSQLDDDTKTSRKELRPIPAEQLGKRSMCDIYDWTSGFFPGTLWYAYELTGDEEIKAEAMKYTNMLAPLQDHTGTHDLGFMVNCSFGNAYRLAPNDTMLPIMVKTAENLAARYDDQIQAIRSWDYKPWNFPVIIDNMMNLELLFWATNQTKDPKYKNIAVAHANTTMRHHYRPDYSSFHLVSYHDDGTIERKETHQGKNDASSWARGQAWGLYGYTVCYRETADTAYLQFAQQIADYVIASVKTDDLIPLWDYDASQPAIAPRDASAAAITASALFELSTMLSDGAPYFEYAETILKNLSGDSYLSEKGGNQGFIITHSTGSFPHGSEIDVPLNYADYYYLEALQRYTRIKAMI